MRRPSTPDAARRSLIQPSRTFPAVIRVVGVGGAGTNAINRMLEAGLEGVEFIAVNTDAQALAMCEADHKLRIGRELTKGLGGGADPRVGREAALAAYDEIKSHAQGQRHGVHHRRRGWRHRHGRRAGRRRDSQVARRADHRRGLAAVRLRGQAPRVAGARRRRRMLRQKADTVIVVPNDKLL